MAQFCEADDTITVLTQGIARLLDINSRHNKVDQYIKHVRTLCYGHPDDKFSNLFGTQLTQNECLDCLLSIDSILNHFLASPEDGQKLANRILNMPKLSGISCQFLSSLLPSIITFIPVESTLPTLESLWRHKDEPSFPLSLVECMFLNRRKVECVLLKMYLETPEEEVSWNILSVRKWIHWSSESSFVFQTITTVLNNILIHSNNRPLILKIISEFIQSVSKCCSVKKLSLINLYPIEFQSLVTVLRLNPNKIKSDPSFNEYKDFTIQSVKQNLSDPHTTLMLLSHYPEWIPFFCFTSSST